MKNITTPRTLAESSFTTGYQQAPSERRVTLVDLAYGVVCAASFVAIGVMLAWRG